MVRRRTAKLFLERFYSFNCIVLINYINIACTKG